MHVIEKYRGRLHISIYTSICLFVPLTLVEEVRHCCGYGGISLQHIKVDAPLLLCPALQAERRCTAELSDHQLALAPFDMIHFTVSGSVLKCEKTVACISKYQE